MKNKGRTIKPSVLIAVIAVFSLLILFAAGFGTYAAYTNSRNAQRTVATYDAHGERFSSNFLLKGNSRDNVKTVYVTEASATPASVVTVTNYERGKQTAPNAEAVSYSLLVRLVKYDGSTTEKYVPVDGAYMTANSLTGYSVTVRKGGTSITLDSTHVSDNSYSGMLTANVASSDVYTVEFSTNFAPNQPNLYVELIVTPAYTGVQALRGILKTNMRAHGATNAWTGAFGDDSAYAPSAYDGYNYVVSGVGDGTVTLSWDDTKVALSDYSLQTLLAISGATKTGSSVTFRVDSDSTSRYDLQFYKINITTENWTTMNSSVVTFLFV